MAMENGPFEDVFPIENGDFPASHVSLLEGTPPKFNTVSAKMMFGRQLTVTNWDGNFLEAICKKLPGPYVKLRKGGVQN